MRTAHVALLTAAAVLGGAQPPVWNRTSRCLFVHGGEGEPLDPLLWARTRYLLTGTSHRQALACLDEFLRSHAERAVPDPVERANMQRELWAVFDWAAAGDGFQRERRALETRLAEAIRRLAVVPAELRTLPDNYAAAVSAGLLPDVFHADGGWICLSAYSTEPTAIVHFTGRSRFLVFMRLPAGRDATLAYIRKLRASSQQPLIVKDGGPALLNLALPQFPAGTRLALVRQAILIDSEGKLIPTALTESVQLRVYHAITPGTPYMNYINGPSSHDQDFLEFRMRRPHGDLVPVHPGETEYATFSTHDMDPFESGKLWNERGVILERCRACHSDSGIHAVQSRVQWMKAKDENGDPIVWETEVTLARKQQQPEFKLLRLLGRFQARP